jgi:hypothetical protein
MGGAAFLLLLFIHGKFAVIRGHSRSAAGE